MKTTKNNITLITVVLLLAVFGTNVSFAGKPTAGKINVTGASPNEAPQGKTLTVKIAGENFEGSSSVTFFVGGTKDASQIIVGDVRFNGASELEADIEVKSGALTVDYDIEVKSTISGRKGKGTTLFKVKSVIESCTDKEPAIVYLTETEKTGPRKDFVYTRDIMLASADGCVTTMLIDDAAQWLPDTKKNEGKNRFIENVSDVRLMTTGNHGVVSWIDSYEQPWVLEYLEFDFDSAGNIFNISADLGSYVSSIGYLIVEQDIRILENGDLLAALMEKEDNGAPRRIVVANLSTGGDEQIINSGLCHYLASDGNCYNPRYSGLVWDPAGQSFYVDLTYISEDLGYQGTLVRYEFDQTNGWSDPLPIISTIGTEPVQKELGINGVSLDGLISYHYLERLPVNGSQRFWGILDPEDCKLSLCNGSSGLIQTDRGIGKWTADDTNLFWENRNLVECLDPHECTNTRILIRGVQEFDSAL